MYVRVDTGKKLIWVATPAFDGRVGDKVSVPPGMPMPDFKSRTLNREFKMVYFVGAIHRDGEKDGGKSSMELPQGHPPIGAPPGSQMMHPPMGRPPAGVTPDIGSVKKLEGGQTVAEVITGRKDLAGKEVRVRAKVVKFTPNIMERNWLHVRDGSGDEGSNDLIVTTKAVVAVGDLVVIRGVLSVDRDFGFGLVYPAIVENATVTTE